MPKSRSVIVVLGVHRSGTSLTARALSALGIRFGENLIPGRRDNPSGFWEHAEIVLRSKAVETKLGINPFHGGLIVPPRTEWWNNEAIRRERRELTDILLREACVDDSVFAFKDPRTLILLPLWQQIFADAGLTPRYVLALRHPADATTSMMRRDISQRMAETVWLAHLSEGFCALDRAPEITISYERWFENPIAQALEIITALRLGDAENLTAALGRAIRSDLRHFSTSAVQLSPLTEELYASALDSARGSFAATRQLAQRARESVSLTFPQIVSAEKKSTGSTSTQVQALNVGVNKVATPYVAVSAIKRIKGRIGRPLSVCIATEDIVGPVRNGGIGTTYTHLSFLLAEAGHHVTIFYLRGSKSATQSIAHWVEWYRERNVRFVPIDPPDDDSPLSRWLSPMVTLYEKLKSEQFDLVHVSEWRGSAYYSLLAKRQGLAFPDTVFCVKASSPFLWNRQYMLAPVDDTSQLVRIFAERRSIELADMVIGGSGHLLTWMEHNGYRMPQGRTFMQPNVAVPAEIDPMLLRNRPQAGTRVPINEIVFFGRLEGRKGLDIFCDAIRDLINEGASVPKITFLGKFGTPIATHPELTVREYIESEASSWGVEWQIIDTYAQAQALTYLLGSGRLAVMPSLIENSSLTIYETTNFRIPFVASDRGGNPELVKEEHRDAVLTEPHPVLLAEKLSEVLKLGGLVAESSFDNASNLAQWCEFHSNLATVIDEIKERRTTPGQTIPSNQITRNLMDHLLAAGVPRMKVTVSACLVLRDNHALIETSLQSLVEQAAVLEEIILINDGSKSDAAVDWILSQREFFKTHGWKIIDRRHYGAADSRNLAAEHAKGSHILFLEPGTALKPNALATLIRAAACSEAHVLLSFYEELPARTTPKSSGRRIISLPGDPCYPFFDSDAGWAPLILVSQDTFKTLGGFTVDYNVAGDVEEFLMHASTTGLTVEVVPEDLAVFQLSPVKRGRLNREGASFRSIRPHLNAVPTNLQPLLIASRSLNIRVEMDQRSILRMAARRWLPNTLQNQLARILRLRLFRPFRRPKA